ncbi:MAG: hypothetical protein AB8E82_06025 [Aureispira sp.]
MEEIETAWSNDGNSIFRVIEPVYEGIGDYKRSTPHQVEDNLYIVSGDLNLSLYEDRLGDTWNSAKGGSRPDIRIQTAIYRYISWCKRDLEIDLVLLDLGPNLGALNRAVLEARKPVFDCTHRDGLRGAHITTARESSQYFEWILNIIEETIQNN